MKNHIYIILITGLIFGNHFEVNLEETGSSTLFIFQDSITSLDAGDEVGLFDLSGIVDGEGNIGELLVGSGIFIKIP